MTNVSVMPMAPLDLSKLTPEIRTEIETVSSQWGVFLAIVQGFHEMGAPEHVVTTTTASMIHGFYDMVKESGPDRAKQILIRGIQKQMLTALGVKV